MSTIASIPIGVVAIEKHFKLDNETNSVDAKFSITPEKLRELVKIKKDLFYSIKNKKKPKIDKVTIKFRRSIFATEDIKKGEKFSYNNIDSLRPLIGISASEFFNILGKRSKKNIKRGTPLKKNFF